MTQKPQNARACLLARALTLGVALLVAAPGFGRQKTELTGELRSRADGRDNADFNADRQDGKVFVLNRLRLNIERTLRKNLRVFLQVQDARLWGEAGSSLAALDNLDLHQSYFEIARIAHAPLRVRLGRQELAFGSGRLVSAYDWHNTGRAFDAARLTLGKSRHRLDLWLAQVRDHNAPTVARNQEFGGAFYHNRRHLPVLFEAYALYFFDGRNFETPGHPREEESRAHEEGGTHLAFWTFGGRIRSAQRAVVGFELEGAFQHGARGPLALRAYGFALHVRLQPVMPLSPKLIAGYTYGSGDDDPTDNRLETFANLFPDVHGFLGAMDYASWSNIAAAFAALQVQPAHTLSCRLAYYRLRLAAENDAWYRAGGYQVGSPAEVYRTGFAGAGRDIGREIDLQFRLRYRQALEIHGGLSVLFTGAFLDRTSERRADDSYFGYLSTKIRF